MRIYRDSAQNRSERRQAREQKREFEQISKKRAMETEKPYIQSKKRIKYSKR